MQQPERGEVRGCCVLWCVDLTPCHKIPHSERKPPPDHCGDTQVEREHLCRRKWVESLKAVMEAAGAVREWCGGQRARGGCKDQERSDQSIGCCRFPPGLQRMCLSNCRTGGKKQVFEVRTCDENRCHMCASKYVNFPVLFWISQWIITVSESSNTSAIVVTYGRDVCGNSVYQPKKVWVKGVESCGIQLWSIIMIHRLPACHD